MADVVLFDEEGVKVTSTKVHVRGTTYPINGITSVQVRVIAADTSGSAFLGVTGVLTLILGAFCAVGGAIGAGENPDQLITAGVGAAVLVAGGILVAIARSSAKAARPTYALVLGTAGGDRQAFASKRRELVGGIRDAIERAVEQRG